MKTGLICAAAGVETGAAGKLQAFIPACRWWSSPPTSAAGESACKGPGGDVTGGTVAGGSPAYTDRTLRVFRLRSHPPNWNSAVIDQLARCPEELQCASVTPPRTGFVFCGAIAPTTLRKASYVSRLGVDNRSNRLARVGRRPNRVADFAVPAVPTVVPAATIGPICPLFTEISSQIP